LREDGLYIGFEESWWSKLWGWLVHLFISHWFIGRLTG
jgi:hypothetical protein